MRGDSDLCGGAVSSLPVRPPHPGLLTAPIVGLEERLKQA
jgi:hypothetical protein